MAKVTNLTIAQQSGTDSTYFASWKFGENSSTSSSTSSSSGAITVGSLVSIKSGATYYNGAHIPDWVMAKKWYVVQVKGDRAVLGKSEDGANNIQSPVNVNNLTYQSGGSSSSSSSGSSSAVTESNLEHYEVKWSYDTGDSTWFEGGESTTKSKNITYSAPSNAIRIRVQVKPVAKTYKSNDKEVPYFTGEWASKEFEIDESLPVAPPTPEVTLEDFTLTATVSGIEDSKADYIYFEVATNVERNGQMISMTAYTGEAVVLQQRATKQWTVSAGGEYRVRCRAINEVGTKRKMGPWSAYSGDHKTPPLAVTNVKVVAESSTSAKVTWTAAANATEYVVEYASNKDYFDSSSQVSSVTVTSTTAFVTGLDGKVWYFRVKAKNSAGDSAWSAIVSTAIGTKPEPPTTWSLTNTMIAGEEITLYWVHNTEDGSKPLAGEYYITLYRSDGSSINVTNPVPVSNTDDESEEQAIQSFKFNPTQYLSDAVKMEWDMHSQGITGEWSDWSVTRTIDIYAEPTLHLSLSSGIEREHVATLSVSDFTIYDGYGAMAFLDQSFDWLNYAEDIGYELRIRDDLKNWHTITDNEYPFVLDHDELVPTPGIFGITKYMTNVPDAVGSLYFIKDAIYHGDYWATGHGLATIFIDQILYWDYPFELIIYKKIPKSIDSELTSLPIHFTAISGPESQTPMSYHVSIVSNTSYETVDPTGDSIMVMDGSEVYSKMFYTNEYALGGIISAGDVTLEDGQSYTLTATVAMDSGLTAETSMTFDVQWDDQTLFPDARIHIDKDTLAAYISPFCLDESGSLASNVMLSVYRRDAHGELIEIATGIPNDLNITITDPHPTLDYARYRIVAIQTTTSGVSYSDLPGYPVGEHAIVIQWDEVWRNYNYAEDAVFADQPWAGSMLKLPWNIDISETYDPDTAVIEYIGRKYPVSYYGTQKGVTASWSTDVVKEDKETIYALRRLAAYSGDVYVREPSGTGYWAKVKVTMPINHLELVVPVKFDIVRVEGGI